MNATDFNRLLDVQLDTCNSMLGTKAAEYATDVDRLHNFKVAAALKGETPKQALAGMMAKHTVSIYDLCKTTSEVDLEVWIEKITDHMNYLILLRAIVTEEQGERPTT